MQTLNLPDPSIGIVGPGAIGCWFATRLHEAGFPVCLVDHDPVRAGRLNQTGIRIEPMDGLPRLVAIPVRHGRDALADLQMVFLCVKSYNTGDVMSQFNPPGLTRACVVSVQNGLGNAESIAAAWPRIPILCAATSQGVLRLEPGSIRHTGNGITQLAAFDPSATPLLNEMVSMLQSAGLPAEPASDVHAMLWSKLVANAGLNAVGALWELPNGRILDHPEAGAMARQAATETAAVAGAMGIHLPFRDPVKAMQTVADRTAGNHSSMWQDRAAGRRTEIDAINGAVVQAGEAHGIPTPANRELIRRISSH